MKKNNKNKKGGSWKRTALTALCVVLAFVFLALLFITVYVNHALSQINRATDPGTLSPEQIASIMSETDDGNPDFTGEVIDPDDIDWADGHPDLINSEDMINILLVGLDRREGQSSARSDSMILCAVNTKSKTITLTSFMRDMYVRIPGYRQTKINASYALGGMSLLDQTLALNFGVQVDGNVEVDFSGFTEAVDIMGGVDITLTQAEANYLNKRGNWDMQDGKDHGGWSLQEGVNHLTGDQALAYSRIRYIGMDFERTERQRNVLNALIAKAKKLSVTQLNDLLNTVLPLVTTDLSNADILGYAGELIPILLDCEVVTQRIPADGTWKFANIDNADVIVVDFEKNQEILRETLLGE